MPEAPPGVDVPRVSRFFAERVERASGSLTFELIGDGRSNLTYLARCGDASWVLRRPPLGHVLPTAHDMSREFRVLRALAETSVPVPRPFVLCEDEAVNGAPFYVMEYTPGVIVADRLPDGFAEKPEERRRISLALIDTLVELHAVDYDAVGLSDFGRPAGYLERQIRRWSEQWERSKTREMPAIDELVRRLRAALPEGGDATIVHGDYRLGNMALDPDDPGRVVAIFDWEMATLGDPLADLGYTLMYCGEASDPPEVLAQSPILAVMAQPGFLSRSELVEAYARRSGRDVSAIDFYRVLALYKSAVISEGIHARFLQGKTVGEGFETFKKQAESVARRALAIADESRLPGLRPR